MVYQLISFKDNANGQILVHTYTKKQHGVTKDRPETVQPYPVDTLRTDTSSLCLMLRRRPDTVNFSLKDRKTGSFVLRFCTYRART